jgi:hypothetical protein
MFVLARVGRPLEATVADLSRHARIDPVRARMDVLRFAYALNRELLANITHRSRWPARLGAWLRLAARLAPAGALPPFVAHRTALDTTTRLRSARGVLGALWRRGAGTAAAAALLGAPGRPTVGALALGLGVAIGPTAHEIGHVWLLGGAAAALVVCGLRTYVMHAPLSPARRRRVAAGGPSLAAVLGVGAVTAAWLAAAPGLALLGGALVVHAVGLTVATADGRTACGL